MKPSVFEYHRPHSLDEALALKFRYGDSAAILAGGQSLVPIMNMRMAQPEIVIDLGTLHELSYVEHAHGVLRIGAMTRARVLERSDIAYAACPLLRVALTHVAHPVIRNRGTIGGSIAHADPAGEIPAMLALLEGTVVARSAKRTREIAAHDFFCGHFTTALGADEILTEARLVTPAPGTGYGFAEIARRHGDFALAGVGALVGSGGQRLVLFGVDSRPVVMTDADPESVTAAIHPTDDIHGSAGYRRKLACTLAASVVRRARDRGDG